MIHLRMKIDLVTVKLKNEIFATNLELNELLFYVASDVICGITIQIIKHVLV